MIFIGLFVCILILVTVIGIEGQLKKSYKQKERIIELLEEIKENQRY